MSNKFNLDQYEKFFITLKGKEYEIIPMTFENLKKVEKLADRWDKIKQTKEDTMGLKQMTTILAELFVQKPAKEVMDELNAVQCVELFKHVFSLAVGKVTVDTEKKS